ncbi:tight adherance operon protein [Pectobacterium brasiliense]|uniref:tight adherance operon protein n=1 Tax=Pectobacterium brasiliense TaxID=180957 RepID=UPI0015DE2344|nr:tight adherance operon protein [Pectobacterium brasiliense]MBA0210497.1 tight adherance operon protein [Pectobacterium brasiliense]
MMMLLFPQKKEEKASPADKVFYILSIRDVVNEQIGQRLSQAGFSKIEHVVWRPGQVSDISLSAHSWGVIIDIGASYQVDDVVLSIKGFVPRGVWCCAVGDSDSITMAQEFARYGIHYFYLNAQAEELIPAAIAGAAVKVRRSSVNIGILGCKGGVGNTTLAYQLVNRLVQLRQKPTLFIQGKSGSNDIDLLFEKKFTQSLTPISQNLDAMSWTDTTFPDLCNEPFEKYNFVIFEESINSSEKEHLRQIVECTSCLVLTLDRSMASVRMVRQIIEIHDAISRTKNTPRRLLLCLKDSRPVTSNMLDVEDLQLLLGRKVDIFFPWCSSYTNIFFSVFGLRSKRNQLETLLQRILGGTTEGKGILFDCSTELKRKS